MPEPRSQMLILGLFLCSSPSIFEAVSLIDPGCSLFASLTTQGVVQGHLGFTRQCWAHRGVHRVGPGILYSHVCTASLR